MSLESAINFAKNASEDKVPFRFQFPVSTKDDFEKLFDKNNVSMTDMILGLIISSIKRPQHNQKDLSNPDFQIFKIFLADLYLKFIFILKSN